MRTLREILLAVAGNAHRAGACEPSSDPLRGALRHQKLLDEAEAGYGGAFTEAMADAGADSPPGLVDERPRYPVIVDGMYGVVLVPADVFERVETATPLAGGHRYLCANAEEVEHLKALGVDVPDELTFDWFKVLSAGV